MLFHYIFTIESTSEENNLEAIANLLHVDRPTSTSHLEHVIGTSIAADENAISKSIIASSPASSTGKFPCAINPCLHGGVCITDNSQPLGHRCDCPSSYAGVLCSGAYLLRITHFGYFKRRNC